MRTKIKRNAARVATVLAVAGIGIIATGTVASATLSSAFSDLRLKKTIRVVGAPLPRR